MIKMIYSNYDKGTGISTVTLRTQFGDITRTTKLHEDDKEIASTYAGCQYAELKCLSVYMKKMAVAIQYQINGLMNLKDRIECTKAFDKDNINWEVKTLYKEINRLKKERTFYKKASKDLYVSILQQDKNRLDFINKFKKEDNKR